MDPLLSEEFAEKLKTLAAENAEKYRTAHPFPNIYFDDFLPVEAAEAALRDFPEPKQVSWANFDNPNEKKLAFDKFEKLPDGNRQVLAFLNSRPMIEFLETLTGITGLVGDPYYEGGGLHQIVPGGKLGVHADFNKHPKLNLDRRLNVLIYLNKDWDESYGGHFELWDREMQGCETKILPVFNRCAIFSTTSWSFHGHPTPLSCPPDRTRKSMATYYYSNGRPAEEEVGTHYTLFAPLGRGGELVPEKKLPPPPAKVEDLFHRETFTFGKLAWALAPPLLYELYKKTRA